MPVRSGDEPVTARSPLRLRLGLALFGAVCAAAALAGFLVTGHPGLAVVFGVIVVLSVADTALVVHRIRQGSGFQPGRDVPPYHPGPGESRRFRERRGTRGSRRHPHPPPLP